MTDSIKISPMPQPGSWSTSADAPLMSALKACNVLVEPIDPAVLRLCAVPLPMHFNKIRTNLLIHREGNKVRVYVDIDLKYNGPNRVLREALNGPRNRNWRQVAADKTTSTVGKVVRSALQLIGSPVLDLMRVDAKDSSELECGDRLLEPNSILATATCAIKTEELSEAFRASVHKPLAHRLAESLTRRDHCGCLVWAPSGSGKKHLLRATAHKLIHHKSVRSVRYLSAARLTCGRVFPTEWDSVLAVLLDELVNQPQLLLLIDYLDLGLSGSMASLSLLAEALDRGARILASVVSEEILMRIKETPLIARRVLPVKVPTTNADKTLRALKHVVRINGYDVSPTVLLAVVEITKRQGATQPAAAIDLLNSVMAKSNWQPHKTITPDDVTSVLKPEWPM